MRGKERSHAKDLFESEEGVSTELALRLSASSNADSVISQEQAAAVAASGKAKTFEVGGGLQNGKAKLTDEQRQRVRKAIENAGSLEEIQRLKRILADGFIPDERTLKNMAKS